MAPDTEPPDYNPEADWEGTGLAAALRALQADLPSIPKSRTAKVDHKGGGSHSYKYADLDAVTKAVLPKLTSHGLVWACLPLLRDDGQFVLRYRLIHVQSGQEITGDYPLERGDAQQTGGRITYARRYALGAVTGISTEEDTDGRGGTGQQQQPKPSAAANGHPRLAKDAPGSAKENAAGLITSIQIKYQELGFKRTDRDDMLSASETIIGRELSGPNRGRTHNNLSEVEARKLRDTIGGYEDRGDLLAALVEAATP